MPLAPITLPQEVHQGLSRLATIPTLPAAASRVLEKAQDPQVSLRALAALIERDPALAAEVLRVANSAFYRTAYGVSSLQRALVVLGVKEVRRICLGVSVLAAFPLSPGHATLDRELFWRHATACAVTARRLTEILKIPRDGEEFTGGMLHDVGKLILDLCFHDRYTEAIDITDAEGIPMRAAERRIFGIDHAVVSAWLCQRWRFPDAMVEAIRWHHEPEHALSDPVLAALVHLADVFSRVRAHGFGGERTPVVLAETAAWRILCRSKPALAGTDLAGLTFRLEEEMARHGDMFLGSGA